MTNSLRENVLKHFENPQPLDAVWQMEIISGILDHAHDRTKQYGLPLTTARHFVTQSLDEVKFVFDLSSKPDGSTLQAGTDVANAVRQAKEDFELAAEMDRDQHDDNFTAENELGISQLKRDVYLVSEVAARAGERITEVARSRADLVGQYTPVDPSLGTNAPVGRVPDAPTVQTDVSGQDFT